MGGRTWSARSPRSPALLVGPSLAAPGLVDARPGALLGRVSPCLGRPLRSPVLLVRPSVAAPGLVDAQPGALRALALSMRNLPTTPRVKTLRALSAVAYVLDLHAKYYTNVVPRNARTSSKPVLQPRRRATPMKILRSLSAVAYVPDLHAMRYIDVPPRNA